MENREQMKKLKENIFWESIAKENETWRAFATSKIS